MELRRDPITKSWILNGDAENSAPVFQGCPYCPGNQSLAPAPIFTAPANAHPSILVYAHPRPLYTIEGRADRSAEGIYDKMRAIGAHEIIIESPDHHERLASADEAAIAQLLECWALRIDDLKRDVRFKYITVFKNQGSVSGQEIIHPHCELTATPFIPRRMLYELRSSLEYYSRKDRCVFCDIEHQEEQQGTRVVDISGSYLAICPFASRVPYEMWIMPRYHDSSFEADILRRRDTIGLAGILRRCLARLEQITDSYHMVLHTSPNTYSRRDVPGIWASIADDYHWHIEILPITQKQTKSYSIKESYYCPVSPETAAARLKDLPAGREVAPQRHLKSQPK